MRLDFAPRLNVLTGDNGLGKTFVLDVAWWVLTHAHPGRTILPRRAEGATPQMRYDVDDLGGREHTKASATYNHAAETWSKMPAEMNPGVVVYARADGGVSTWDAVRNRFHSIPGALSPRDRPEAYHFQPTQIWDGLSQLDRVLCNGLIRDWVSWQYQNPPMFDTFSSVLHELSPDNAEGLRPGKPTRISIEDARDIPTLEMPYGPVPVTHAAAGVRRILGLAYTLVWAWTEYRTVADLAHARPVQRLVLLMDEIEAHLHPQWQRRLLPSLLEAARCLPGSPSVQIIASTHAPLVLASVETVFDDSQDRVFSFELNNGEIAVEQIPWAKQGDAVGWLTSEVFGLEQARSREAERAIEAAYAYMRGDTGELPKGLKTEDEIHKELVRVLPDDDQFWPRWIIEREKGSDDSV